MHTAWKLVGSNPVLVTSIAYITEVWWSLCFTYLIDRVQYSSQVTSLACTCKYHKGTPRGLNVEIPCVTPVGNCVDNHKLREYFYSSARISQGLTCAQASRAQQPAAHCSYLCTIFIRLPGLVATEVALIISSICLRLLFWSLHGPRHGQIESPLVW